jgi:molybdopterin synthase sulfur carrier subunit
MKILFFGVLSELAGNEAENVDFSGTVKELKQSMIERYPEFAEHKFQVAVNQKLVQDAELLKGNEEVALLPPFTGG